MSEDLFFGDRADRAIRNGVLDRGFIIDFATFGLTIVVKREDGRGSGDAEATGDAEVFVNNSFRHS